MKGHNVISPYYPVFLNICGKKCLVVGGGEVALRKVRALLAHGANIQVVSTSLCSELNHMAGDGVIQLLQKGYEIGDLQDTAIVVAATDDTKINERVANDARRQGILVNVVDGPHLSDFIVPSYFTRGDIIIAVSTSGKSPALARKIRTELEKKFIPEYSKLALLASEDRSELKQEGITVDGDDWQKVMDLDTLIKRLENDKRGEAKVIMLKDLRKLGWGKT